MKHIIRILLFVSLFLMAISCSEGFLEVDPQQSIADEDALETLQDFEAVASGLYDRISLADYYGRYFILVPDVMADDVKQNSQANRAKEYAEYVAFAEHFITEGMWERMYEAVNSANAIINSDAEIAPVEAEDHSHIVGEAYALRGQIYFDLVRLYGQHYTYTDDASHLGVPIVLEHDRTIEPQRDTVAEVYDQIISDMTTAISMMKPTTRTSSTSTLSSTAVKALLARVYLYMEDWSQAEQLSTEVINSGSYTLVPNGNYVPSWASDYSSESIFEIAMTETDNRGSDALGRMYIVEGYGDYLPSGDLTSLIAEGDVRRELYTEDSGLTGDYAPFRMNKYPSIQGQDNTKVIRLSEVYLIRAEAAAMQSQENFSQSKEDIARADVTLIRQRGLPDADPVTASGQALLDEIALERRIELAYEGQRLWDLMRKKQDMVRDQCTSLPSACTVTYPNDRFVLPIPAAELNTNSNMTQNSGY